MWDALPSRSQYGQHQFETWGWPQASGFDTGILNRVCDPNVTLMVKELIGTPHLRQHILRNVKPGSARFHQNQPEENYRLVTFDQRAGELRELKAKGFGRLYVCLAGWPHLGYDRRHPDQLPPAPEAGGWESMKRYAETARELGYLFVLHDQYRDYYVDAPSYQPQFAIHDEVPRSLLSLGAKQPGVSGHGIGGRLGGPLCGFRLRQSRQGHGHDLDEIGRDHCRSCNLVGA